MRILLVVDLQPEFRDNDGQYEKILEFVKTTKDYDRIVATKCYNAENSSFVKYDCWHDCLDKVEELEFKADEIIAKVSYGLTTYSLLNPKYSYDIIGFNTDCCVQKIAMDMFDRGYDFRVLSQYCYSSLGLQAHLRGKESLKINIGKAFVE